MARLGRSQPNRPIITRNPQSPPAPVIARAAQPVTVHLTQPHRAFRRRAQTAIITRPPRGGATFFLPNYAPLFTAWQTGELTS